MTQEPTNRAFQEIYALWSGARGDQNDFSTFHRCSIILRSGLEGTLNCSLCSSLPSPTMTAVSCTKRPLPSENITAHRSGLQHCVKTGDTWHGDVSASLFLMWIIVAWLFFLRQEDNKCLILRMIASLFQLIQDFCFANSINYWQRHPFDPWLDCVIIPKYSGSLSARTNRRLLTELSHLSAVI